MINRQALLNLVDRAERGALLPGEAVILRDAVLLLDDLAGTLEKIMGSAPTGYDLESTQQLKIIANDDHRGNRP